MIFNMYSINPQSELQVLADKSCRGVKYTAEKLNYSMVKPIVFTLCLTVL